MRIERKSTGLFARNGEIYVGDSVRFDDGWMILVARIEEVDGKFGFFFQDDLGIFCRGDEFNVLTEWPQFFEGDSTNEDFEILPEDHNEWYGIHAPLPGKSKRDFKEE